MAETVIDLADGAKAVFDNDGKRLFILSGEVAAQNDLSSSALQLAEELHGEGQALMLTNDQLASVSLALAYKSVLGSS